MRPALLVASASVAFAHVVAATSPDFVSPLPATLLSSPPPPAAAAAADNQSAPSQQDIQASARPSSVSPSVSLPMSRTATHLSSTSHLSDARPNATASQAAEVTGGAIPQQMQASVVGLLGFCIVGLVML
ncbi:hypothetical protein HRG_008007 [Hirsutella rhossiliensis]|uniref:Uncharacterized protein n=1 Tax=Hirsutella rhossiliensis TaxID=111463 RepID=A0A9P8MUU9_9HYPO|nr:uncharacterized protein HRG_08007 [Hirsutella rhossiliensis]KAH0960854.1 hypothetical protein HRG_08007 [Hirsutella rhossiliensis]